MSTQQNTCINCIRIIVSLMAFYIGANVIFGRALSVIPQPLEMEVLDGFFTLNQETIIITDDNAVRLSVYMKKFLASATGYEFPVNQISAREPAIANSITLQLAQNINDLKNEGYVLSVKKNGIIISAQTKSGMLYAIQTLRQLLPVEIERLKPTADKIKWDIPFVEIRDQPRFSWRGLMIDCSRTFWHKDYLKRIIRLMSLYKLNQLHLHLTDDQGWRLEIKKYPKLTEIGSRFSEKYNEPLEREGYYSQNDIKELIEYGNLHNVTIIPEIEMPSHSLALLTCYPELSCNGGPYEIYPYFKRPGKNLDVLCAGNEKTFQLLENVISEVVELFPSQFIHIGGDETPKARWKTCPKCQARIKDEGLKNEDELQSYFIKRIEKFVNAKGKRIIGWDEILEGGLAPNAAVMSWRGKQGGIAAAQARHDVVMSPTSHCYFDYSYENISTMKVYSFEPVPIELSREEAKHILGAQANFWSHIDRTESGVDKQLFPRLLSIAEITWSPKNQRNKKNFLNRVQIHLKRLNELEVMYYHDPTVME